MNASLVADKVQADYLGWASVNAAWCCGLKYEFHISDTEIKYYLKL